MKSSRDCHMPTTALIRQPTQEITIKTTHLLGLTARERYGLLSLKCIINRE